LASVTEKGWFANEKIGNADDHEREATVRSVNPVSMMTAVGQIA